MPKCAAKAHRWHTAARFEDDLETDRLTTATTLDLFAAAPLWSRLSLIVRVEKQTDEAIVTRDQGGSIDLGVPRTLWLGARDGFQGQDRPSFQRQSGITGPCALNSAEN